MTQSSWPRHHPHTHHQQRSDFKNQIANAPPSLSNECFNGLGHRHFLIRTHKQFLPPNEQFLKLRTYITENFLRYDILEPREEAVVMSSPGSEVCLPVCCWCFLIKEEMHSLFYIL